MKKFTAILCAFLLLASSSPLFAAVGVKKDGTLSCTATDLNFKAIGSSLDCGGSTATFNLLLGGFGASGATSMTTSDLAVPVAYSYVRKAISADPAFSAGTLADGSPGQLLRILITAKAGTVNFTVTPTTKSQFTSITFDAINDSALLLFVDTTTGWIIIETTNATINY